jgi:HEPN domain-containing protein
LSIYLEILLRELRDLIGIIFQHIPTRYSSAWSALPPHKHYSRSESEEALGVAVEIIEFVKREVERGP